MSGGHVVPIGPGGHLYIAPSAGGAALDVANSWTAVQTFLLTDAGTDTTLRPIVLSRTTSGTAAAGLGVGVDFQLEDDGGTLASAGSLDLVWSDDTDTSEDASLRIRAMVAGSIVEAVRFGAGATLPDVDYTCVLGRIRFDSRTTDQAVISHRDMTGSSQYALKQLASGQTLLNCASGQSIALQYGTTDRVLANATGLGFFAATPVVQQTVGAVTNSVTAGGSNGTIADYAIVDYATDAATIRNDLHQLGRSVAQLAVAIRNLGLGA